MASVFFFSFWGVSVGASWCRWVAHSLVPVQLLLGKLVGAGMVEESLLKLWVDGVELLEGSLLSHGRYSGGEEEGV